MVIKKWVSNKEKYKLYVREEQNMVENIIERPCTPIESLKQSLIEMKLIRERKMPKQDLKSFLNSLEMEISDDE